MARKIATWPNETRTYNRWRFPEWSKGVWELTPEDMHGLSLRDFQIRCHGWARDHNLDCRTTSDREKGTLILQYTPRAEEDAVAT